MTWKAIIDKADSGKYTQKITEIADVLMKDHETDGANIAVMGGKAGFALFYFYCAKMTAEEKYYDFGIQLLHEIFDEINKDFVYHTFAGGLSGIGWTVEHLVQNEFIEADSDEILSDLDPYLHKTMIADMQNKNYDYLHGAAGNGIYFLSRLGNPKAKDYLVDLVDELEKLSEKEDDGAIKWLSVLNREDGSEGYNLSLSHGISSLIYLLSRLVENDIHKAKAGELLEGAVKFLLKNKLDTNESLSWFPSWVTGETLNHSRLAWCYGDLGNGLALWQAGKRTGNKEWQEIAEKVILHASKRKDIKENMVVDAGLCHGAAGIGHIFNRMYHYTGNPEFKDTAKYWFDVTLTMASHEDGLAGFKAWHTEKYGGWVAEKGFLEGGVGIGLSLITLVSDIEAGWDGCLLMS